MTVRVNRLEFLSQLESVQPGLSANEFSEQSSSFAFIDGQVMTYNDEVACTSKSLLNGKFKGAVLAKPLLDLLRKLKDEELDLGAVESDFEVSHGRKKAWIRMDPEVSMPISAMEKPETWLPLHEDFTEAVAIVQECAGKREDQFDLTCIRMHPKWVESFDGTQLTRYRLKTGVLAPCLLRRDSVKHIIGLDMTEFAETAEWLHFRNPSGLVFSCRRYEEQVFPDLTPLLNECKEGGVPMSLPRDLGASLECAEIFTSVDKENNLVKVKMKPGKIFLRGEGDHGGYTESKDLKYKGAPQQFNVTPKLLIELSKRHTKCLVGDGRLVVNGEKWVYVAWLRKPEEK